MLLALGKDIIIRKEDFGGIVFNRRNGTTIELDKEAYELVKLFRRPINVKIIRNKDSLNIVKTLFENGILIKTTDEFDGEEKEGGFPHVVHFSITSNCNFSCPCCYRVRETEMPREKIFSLIDELYSIGIFQLAIGGGEPFLRNDIFEILEYCKGKIVCNITTNGFKVKENTQRLEGLVQQINVSLNGFSSLANSGRDERSFKVALDAIDALSKFKINFGVNILVGRENLYALPKTFKFLVKIGVKRVVSLRPKGEDNNSWYKANKLEGKHLKILKEILEEWENMIDIHVDCSLMELMSDIPEDELLKRGVYGCQPASKICTITPSGYVLACSFLKSPRGRFTDMSFKEIWNSKQFRLMRENRRRLNRIHMCDV